jgi:hypothetical protein
MYRSFSTRFSSVAQTAMIVIDVEPSVVDLSPVSESRPGPPAKIREPTITTEREEVKAAGLLIANKPLGHPNIVHPAECVMETKDGT